MKQSFETHQPCDCCGRVWHLDLLDGKPEAGEDPDTADFERLEGPCCYGDGWLPLGNIWADGRAQGIRAGLWRAWNILLDPAPPIARLCRRLRAPKIKHRMTV